MKRGVILIFLFVLVLSFVNAGWLDKLFGKEPQLAPQNFTVEVGNVAPAIINVQTLANFDLEAASPKNITINFTAEDPNGASTLDGTTTYVILNRTGEPLRTNTMGDCILIGSAGNQANYSCNVTMWYYDDNGQWDINISIADDGGLRAENSTESFEVNLLRHISLSPPTIDFPTVVQGQTNIISNQNTTVTNDGNFEVPEDGGFSIKSQNLNGTTIITEIIPGDNFNSTGSSGAATVCTGGTQLSTGVAINIPNVDLGRGAVAPQNTEDIAHCLTLVPIGISTQTYTTALPGGTPWIFEI